MNKRTQINEPKTLNDIVLADEGLRADFEDYAEGYATGTLLFYGVSGTGKSTLAKVIANARCEMDTVEFFYLNASDTKSTRKMSYDWLASAWQMAAFSGTGVPVMMIDEVDRLTQKQQDALKAFLDLLERQKHNAKYDTLVLLTTNYKDDLMPALRSRCVEIPIRGLKPEDAVVPVQRILQQHGIVETDKKVLAMIQNCLPANTTRLDWRDVVEACSRKVRRNKRQQAQQQTTTQYNGLRLVK